MKKLVIGICVLMMTVGLTACKKDDTVKKDDSYVIKTYDYPILAKVPDLMSNGTKKRYGYYYQSKNSSES